MNKTWENDKKASFGPDFGPFGPKSGRQFLNFFSKIWVCQSLDFMISYHHVQYQKKTKDLILRKLNDGQKDGKSDGREWFHRTLSTNVERTT